MPVPAPPGASPSAALVSCSTCRACCCRLEVLLADEDDVPEAMVARDRWGGSVLARLEDGFCVALDRASHRCTIYARRPQVCRDYAVGDHDCLVERAAAGLPV